MANWKKVLVSGSDIEINEIQATGGITASNIDPNSTGGGEDHVLVINSDGHVLKRAQSDVQGVTTAVFTLTGSAGNTTASFDATGDALHLSSSNGDFTITVDSSSNANITSIDFNFKNAVVSGAAQIANAISGAFGAISGNLHTTSQSLETISGALHIASGNLYLLSSSFVVASGNLYSTSQSLEVVSGNLYSTSQSLENVSGNLYQTSTSLETISSSLVSVSSSVSTINVENDGFALSGSIIGTPNQIKLTADAGRVKQDADFTLTTNVSDATADTTTLNATTTVSPAGGTGLTLTFTTTAENAIDENSISVHTAGTGYSVDDVITIPAAQIPGATTDAVLDALTATQITTTNKGFQIGLVDDVQITGSLVVSKSLTADSLTLLGLSLIDNNAAVISGSNIFGSDAETDFHQFTGSVNFGGGITGSTIPVDNSRVVKDLLAVTSDGHFVKVGTGIHAAISGAIDAATSSLSSSIAVVSGNLYTTSQSIGVVSGNLYTTSQSIGVVSGNLYTTSQSLVVVSGNLYTTSQSLEVVSGNLYTTSQSLEVVSGNLYTTSQSLEVVSGNLYTTSQSLEVVSGNLYTTSQSLEVVSGNLYTTSQSISTISGNLYTTSQSLGAISGNLYSTSQSLETLSSSVFSVSALATANSSALQNLGSITGDVTGTHVSMSVLGIQGVAISANEAAQIAEIGDATTISATQWGYLAALNQSLTTDSNVEFDNLTVENLTVTSTTTNINTTNLNVSDRFILLNSHSLAAEDAEWSPQDGGIVVQLSGSYAGTKVGTALYYDNTEERWALVGSASNASGDATGLVPDQLIVSVKTAAGLPGSNPVDFGNDNDSWYGMMHIDTNDTDGDGNNIYIYA